MPITSRLPSADERPRGDLAPDRELLDRFARGGDQQAFETLVRRHGPRVLGVCRRVLGDPHAADDAFQSTFLVLARKGGRLTNPDALGGWLYGVAARVAIKAKRGRPLPLPADGPATGEPDPARVELVRILDEELGRLADRDRNLLVLVYLDGKTHDEAARAVGCPVGSVAWRLERARAALRQRLVRRGVGLGVGTVLLLGSFGQAQAVTEVLVRRTAAAVPAVRREPLTLLALLLLTLFSGGVYAGFFRGSSAAAHVGKPDPTTTPTPGVAPAVAEASSCHSCLDK